MNNSCDLSRQARRAATSGGSRHQQRHGAARVGRACARRWRPHHQLRHREARRAPPQRVERRRHLRANHVHSRSVRHDQFQEFSSIFSLTLWRPGANVITFSNTSCFCIFVGLVPVSREQGLRIFGPAKVESNNLKKILFYDNTSFIHCRTQFQIQTSFTCVCRQAVRG